MAFRAARGHPAGIGPHVTASPAKELRHAGFIPSGGFAYGAFQGKIPGPGDPYVVALVAMVVPGIKGIEHPLTASGARFVLGIHHPLHAAEFTGVVFFDAYIVTSGAAAGAYAWFPVGADHPQVSTAVAKRFFSVPGLAVHKNTSGCDVFLDISTVVFRPHLFFCMHADQIIM